VTWFDGFLRIENWFYESYLLRGERFVRYDFLNFCDSCTVYELLFNLIGVRDSLVARYYLRCCIKRYSIALIRLHSAVNYQLLDSVALSIQQIIQRASDGLPLRLHIGGILQSGAPMR
jgi:hypothetical protein